MSAVRTARLKSHTDLSIERFRAANADRIKALDLAIAESEPLAQGLSQLWGDLQSVRELIPKVVAPGQLDANYATEVVRAASKSVSGGYAAYVLSGADLAGMQVKISAEDRAILSGELRSAAKAKHPRLLTHGFSRRVVESGWKVAPARPK